MGKVTKLNQKERDFLNSYEPTGKVRTRIHQDLNLIESAMMDVYCDISNLGDKLRKIKYLRVSTHCPKLDSVYDYLDKGLGDLRETISKVTNEDESKLGSDILDQLDEETRKVQEVKHDWGMDFDDYCNGKPGGRWDD